MPFGDFVRNVHVLVHVATSMYYHVGHQLGECSNEGYLLKNCKLYSVWRFGKNFSYLFIYFNVGQQLGSVTMSGIYWRMVMYLVCCWKFGKHFDCVLSFTVILSQPDFFSPNLNQLAVESHKAQPTLINRNGADSRE